MIVVADAGTILHLHWIGSSSWALPEQVIHIVEEVWIEIDRHAPAALDDPRFIRTRAPASTSFDGTAFLLHAGETAAITFALAHSGALVLTDDEAARRACKVLEVAATGTIGLIVEALRSGRVTRSVAVGAIESLPTQGRLHVSPEFLARVVASLEA